MTTRMAGPFRIDDPSPNPKAIVLLFGWFGAEMKHVQKYGELWRARHCNTVAGILNEFAIVTKNDHDIDKFVLLSIQEVIPLLRANDQLPLIIHGFSNGGCIPIERLEKLLVLTRSANTLDPDLKMVLQRLKLGAEIFDSAPAWSTFTTGVKAMREAIPNIVLLVMAIFVSVSYSLLEIFFQWYSGRPTKFTVFWNHIKTSTICMRQAFIYSMADNITSYTHLETEIIESRRKLGVDVTILKFDDTGHVQHLQKHQAEYGKLIDVMLLKVGTSLK